jgi:hypothetical protein
MRLSLPGANIAPAKPRRALMHDLPLPTFPIADLGAPLAPRGSPGPRGAVGWFRALWTWFGLVMKTTFAGAMGANLRLPSGALRRQRSL